MPSFKEIFAKQRKLRDQIAIATQVIRYLNQRFIGSEAKPAEEKMLNDEGVVIPQESIGDFIEFLNDNVISPKRVQLQEIENVDIVDAVIAKLAANPGLLPFSRIKVKAK